MLPHKNPSHSTGFSTTYPCATTQEVQSQYSLFQCSSWCYHTGIPVTTQAFPPHFLVLTHMNPSKSKIFTTFQHSPGILLVLLTKQECHSQHEFCTTHPDATLRNPSHNTGFFATHPDATTQVYQSQHRLSHLISLCYHTGTTPSCTKT